MPALRRLDGWFGPVFFGPLLLAAALTPAAWSAVEIATTEPSFGQDEQPTDQASERRRLKKLLAEIPRDPSVLINVTARDMPASPDLVNLGKRATQATMRCLSDNTEAELRARCAIVLEALGDRQALPALQHALEDWDGSVRLRAVKALGAVPDASSVAPLIGLFRRKDELPAVRAQILRTFGAISDQRVVSFLRGLIAKKPEAGQEDLRPEAFDALWLNRHLMARTTLVADVKQALASENERLVLAAALSAAELRAPELTSALIPLMENADAEIANKAIYALGRIGDKTATKALIARLPQVRESRMLNNIAFALERLDRQAFYSEIAKTAASKQAVIRLNADFVLGDVGHSEGLPLLQKSLGDASDFVRTSAVAAIGKLALDGAEREHAQKALEPLAGDKILSLREEAIYALNALTPGGRADLIHDRLFVGLDPNKHAESIRRAALALGAAGDPRVRDYLLGCLLSRRCGVPSAGPYFTRQPSDTASGRMLLAWARGDRRMSGLLSDLRPAGAEPLAVAALRDGWPNPDSGESISAIELLGGLGDPSAASLLRQRAGADRTFVRILSLVAAVRLGDSGGADALIAEMDNLAAEALPELVFAMSGIAEPAARAKLDPLLQQKQAGADVRQALCAAAIRLAWAPTDSREHAAIFRLLDGLASPSSFEREIAAHYLGHNRDRRVTWVLRRALAREGRKDVADRLRALLDER